MPLNPGSRVEWPPSSCKERLKLALHCYFKFMRSTLCPPPIAPTEDSYLSVAIPLVLLVNFFLNLLLIILYLNIFAGISNDHRSHHDKYPMISTFPSDKYPLPPPHFLV